MKTLANLEGELKSWATLEERLEDAMELAEMGDESIEDDLQKEVLALQEEIEKREFDAMLAGEYDRGDALLAIHAGAGGNDAQDWAEMLQRMYLRWAEKRGYKAETLDLTPGEEAGIKSTTISINGLYAYGYLRSEKGVHRLVRISPFDSSNRRHTSFVLVEILPQVDDDQDININPNDLRIDTFRSGGAGGQSVQKNSTAVRLTHLPTGIVVQCQDERSQLQNRLRAMGILRARLYEMEESKRQTEIDADRKSQVGSGDRSEKIRTYNFPQSRVTDHRINISSYNITGVMDGDIYQFIEELATRDEADRLAVAGL